MPDLPVAVLSDIHGNRWALEAVLDDVRRRGGRRKRPIARDFILASILLQL